MKEDIRAAINMSLVTLNLTEVDFVVDFPTDRATKADYYSNVAMVVARKIGKSPVEVAKTIKDLFLLQSVTSVEVAGPGFLNFYVANTCYTEQLKHILEKKETWGRNDSWAGKKVLVEYTDPNPFKEFHIGHLFTNAVGESIARLFMMNGADTKRINYQGDVGLHVANAIYGMQQLGISAEGTCTVRDIGKAYALGTTAYKNSEDIQKEIRDINKKVYDKTDPVINELYDWGKNTSLLYFETIYKTVDTYFDEYFFESEAGPLGKELVLNNPDIFPESEGARIFDGEVRGLHTRVFLNKEGLPTYEAKELALAKLKDERFGGYDHSVISTANEINEYFKVLLCAMGEIYPELAKKTEHIGHGMVRLTTGKMSSRTGDVITALSFIKEVADAAEAKMIAGGVTEPNYEIAQDIAVAAIKYATLRGSILQDSTFDKDRALSFEGDSGPYLQYTHARICSVLEKATVAGVIASTEIVPAELYEVQKLVTRFPAIIATALHERAPHKVTTYLTELAGAFNSFYAIEKIADATDEYAPYKVAVADAVRTTLKNGLWVLGIKAPERM